MAGLWLYARAGGDAVWYACGLVGVLMCLAFVQIDAARASEESRSGFEAPGTARSSLS